MKDADPPALAIRSISDVPSIADCTLGRGRSFVWNRRQLLQRAFGGAVALSLVSLSALPPARRAYASHPGSQGYQILDSCPGYADGHNCNPGCGPSTVCSSRSGGHCCITNPDKHKYGWHKHNSAYPRYKLRPDACVSGTGWDGWKWRFSNSCGCCGGGLTYRCHDGWWRNDSGTWVKRICRWTTNCNPPFC